MQKTSGDTKKYTATEARNRFSDIFDEAYFGERVIVRKRDRSVAVVSIALLEKFEQLLELEAAIEAHGAKNALKEFQSEGGKTMEQMTQPESNSICSLTG
jgi:prevent-host-death family protein